MLGTYQYYIVMIVIVQGFPARKPGEHEIIVGSPVVKWLKAKRNPRPQANGEGREGKEGLSCGGGGSTFRE